MASITVTDKFYPWAKRVGGGYPQRDDLLNVLSLSENNVLVGKPHHEHGFFAVLAGTKPVAYVFKESDQPRPITLLHTSLDPKKASS